MDPTPLGSREQVGLSKRRQQSSSRGRAVRPRRVLLCAFVLAALLTPLAATAATAQVPRSFWGVIPIMDPGPSEFERMGSGNVGTLRLLVVWPDVEPSPDAYDWSRLDFFFANAAASGIEVLPFLYGTPSWTGVDCKGLDAETCERVPPLSKAARAAWSDFLQDLVARYGPQGSFWSESQAFLPLTNVQIWNEPSSQFYWRPKPNPKKYGTLVKLSRDAVASVDPSVKIVLAGVFPSPAQSKKFGFAKFLEKLYDVKKIKRYFDIAAFHPYAGSIKVLKKQVKAIRKVMRAGGVKSKPLWITEIGWGSGPPQKDRPLVKGVEGQRKLLEQSFQLLEAKRTAWKLSGVVWYSWRDPGFELELCPFCSSAGLFDADGNPKPAWLAYVQKTGGSDSPPSPPPEGPPPGCPLPPLPC
jgi:hypothetical protein